MPTADHLSTATFWSSRLRRAELFFRSVRPGRIPDGMRELTQNERERAYAIDPTIGQPFGLWADAGYTDAQVAQWWLLVTLNTLRPEGAARLSRFWELDQINAARSGAPVIHRGAVLIPGTRDTPPVVTTSLTAAVALLDYLAAWHTHQAALARAWRDEAFTDLVKGRGGRR